MKYTFNSRIRYSEVDQNGVLTTPNLINYFQDCSAFQSEDIGLGFEVLQERHKVWVLNYWQIEVIRYPRFGEKVNVETFATGFKGICAQRNFVLYDQDKQLLARADSVWTFIDLTKGRPVKPKTEDIAAYGIVPPLEMEQKGRKIKRAERTQEYPAFAVQPHHLDTNQHVNNGQYIQMVMNLFTEEIAITNLRVEYKKAAVYGDMIFPQVAIEAERIVVELCDEMKTPYAIVEIGS